MNESIRKFLKELNEDLLFQLIKNISIYKNIQKHSSNQFDVVDCYLPDQNEIWELKCRSGDHYSHLLEYKKYKALLKYEKPFYISSNENGIFKWNLKDNLFFDWRIESHQKNNTNKNIKKNKEVTYLNPGFGVDITKEILYYFY